MIGPKLFFMHSLPKLVPFFFFFLKNYFRKKFFSRTFGKILGMDVVFLCFRYQRMLLTCECSSIDPGGSVKIHAYLATAT